MIKIIDTVPEHFDIIDRRDYEKDLVVDVEQVLKTSKVIKTVFMDDKVLTIYGISDDGYLFQLASSHINEISMKYARAVRGVVKELVDSVDEVYTVCINDEFHQRWMRFIGFEKVDDRVHVINGIDHAFYGVIV